MNKATDYIDELFDDLGSGKINRINISELKKEVFRIYHKDGDSVLQRINLHCSVDPDLFIIKNGWVVRCT